MNVHRIAAGVLDVAFEDHGDRVGWPVVLLHGFPYDVRAFDEVVPLLVAAGARVVVPYLRGYGPTTFRKADTMRSGQQAALGADLVALLDALAIHDAVLAGFDWGGRAACVVAAIRPERVAGLVACGGYTVQDIAAAAKPAEPEKERRNWYQFYLHGERGRAGLSANRRSLCTLLWKEWSPGWAAADAAFARTAPSLDNADFVDVVVHSYRHRYGLAAGDAQYASIEARLATAPVIAAPTIALYGAADGVDRPAPGKRRDRFVGPLEERVLDGVGHDVPQEAPAAFARAVLDVHAPR